MIPYCISVDLMMLGVHMILLNSPDYVYETKFKYIHISFEYYLALESSKYMYYMIYTSRTQAQFASRSSST